MNIMVMQEFLDGLIAENARLREAVAHLQKEINELKKYSDEILTD